MHTIICPTCRNNISIDDVLSHQIEDELKHQYQAKHEAEIRELKTQLLLEAETKAKEIEAVKRHISEQMRLEAITKVRQEYRVKIEATKEEASAREKQNQELQEQVKILLKQMRELKETQQTLEIEYEKKLLAEEENIRQKAREEALTQLELKIAEKDKKLTDAMKANEELKRKLEQGSQQLQGEVLELQLFALLQREFTFDELREVPKGIGGADVIQVVRSQNGMVGGTIIWESKNTKHWTAGWIQKLKEDQRALKADVAVLVTTVLPPQIKRFGVIDGIMVLEMESVVGIAYLLRQQLLKLQAVALANQDRTSKAEMVYHYLLSNEFKQRLEVMVEYIKARRLEIDKERLYFTKKWEKEEHSTLKLLESAAGMYGDLQGMVGNVLPKITTLELPE